MPNTGASITETFTEHISICILLKKLKQSIDLKADTKYETPPPFPFQEFYKIHNLKYRVVHP